MNILLLGARAPVALEWARLLHGSGHRVFSADSALLFPLTRFSGTVRRYCRLPSPRQHFRLWVDALTRLIRECRIDWVLPTCEEVFYLAAARPLLQKYCRVFTADFSLLSRLHNKYECVRLCSEFAGPVHLPESHLLTDSRSLGHFHESSWKWVFKPVFSRFASHTRICPDQAALMEVSPSLDSPWVAQRHIPGREYCSYSILDQGRVVAHCCYQPVYRAGQGAGIYFRRTELPAAEEFVQRFGEHTGFSGQVGFDFIFTEKSQLWMLECNPRATSGLHLFSGHKSLGRLFSQTLPQKLAPVMSSDAMVGMAMALLAAPANLVRSRFWRDWLQAKDAVWRLRDPLPQLGQLISACEYLCREAGEGLHWRNSRSLRDIEWDGDPQLQEFYRYWSDPGN